MTAAQHQVGRHAEGMAKLLPAEKRISISLCSQAAWFDLLAGEDIAAILGVLASAAGWAAPGIGVDAGAVFAGLAIGCPLVILDAAERAVAGLPCSASPDNT